MKKIYFLSFCIICGILYGFGRKGISFNWAESSLAKPANRVPPGMVIIPQGRTLIGMTDEDLSFFQGNPSRMTTFSAFYMDQTETSNAEYRKFVNWVRDSIAITSLGPSGAPNLYKSVPNSAGSLPSAGPRNIDWNKLGKNSSVLWGKNSAYKARLQDMYYTGKDALPGKQEIDVRKLKYAFSYVDQDLAVAGADDPTKKRQDFIVSYSDNPTPGKSNEHPSLGIYPDTAVWKKDFSYSQNDPMVKTYFSHPTYSNYPVVGVTWEQANAFCHWRTTLAEKDATERKTANSISGYRLPTEQEFEYAARGGKVQNKFPWGGPYMTSEKGCFLANFKVGRGNYSDDEGMYTVDVKSYIPNDYGLYNIAGNVAEWTSSTYNPSATSLLLDFNPNYTSTAKGNKVVRGGSWKDISLFLQNSVSTYERQDKGRSYIGFRCVSSINGSSTKEFNQKNKNR